ncbi:MAG: tRNA uridine-5-carboxymethylaminomethyl(34) synthesis GTPase MnmE [Candidatus Omnitrophica bacterium]|nr:tRNA uridine-5-carboxymethylaminomethyl(34) synthesis GTPase MnmE [Candidatus Omnitrophota bacterium]MCM8777157.1 tRNA uridine-5-carboxymethylaminomethyl(34) synthesis GTPase MnmE [Candidatus Omnitrophota bacterium]
MKNDTICAISTPLGISGIGIIRLSGPDTYRIIDKIFRPAKKIKISDAPSHTVHYGHIVDGKKIIDEVLVTIMRSPKSYTREDMAEIGCHGGLIPMKEVLSLCIKNGARQAEPGEFTKRAFLNGRIDLAQAESVLEVIYSKTEKALEISAKKLKGAFSSEIKKIKTLLIGLFSDIQAKIDFPEEEDIERYNLEILSRIEKIICFIDSILSRAVKGKIIQQGINAAIIGRVNAGKSSLLNALLKEERAIVTEIPGTTRDILQETINVKGIPVNIIDTAGIRKVRGQIEKMGVEKALEWMKKADINLVVLDGSKKLNEYDHQLLNYIKDKRNYVLIINKNDIPQRIERDYIEKHFLRGHIISISTKKGEGVVLLEETLYKLILEGYGEIKGDEIFLNIRQEGKIKETREILLKTKDAVIKGITLDIVAEYLKESINRVDEITGKDISEEVLEQIFSKFCIGK